MKKVLIAILAFFYLSTSVGATLHLHYCMDKLVSWGFGHKNSGKKTCPFCGMAKKTSPDHCIKQAKGCCKDEQKLIKVEKEQKASLFENSFNKQAGAISYASEIPLAYHKFSPVLEHPTSHAPPFIEKVPVFISNCVFRI